MPLYEYQCDACGHRFEKIQKFSDPIVDTCPICGGAVRKLMSSPAIQFKGSGFYITDYAKKDQGGDRSDSGAADKAAKSESSAGKSEKGEKGEKGDTSGKSGNSEKSEKSAAAASSDKSGAASSSSGSSDSGPSPTKAKS